MTAGSGLPPAQRTVVMKTRSPQTTGPAWPSPTSGAFQATFSAFSPPHWTGRVLSAVTPMPVGPRNWGHSSDWAAEPRTARIAAAPKRVILKPPEGSAGTTP
jgi:hypothetical protein